MSKLSDLIKSKNNVLDSLTPSETALHALNRDDDGKLTYTKVYWNSNETINITNGEGFAYNGVEEFVEGISSSNVLHNSVTAGANSSDSYGNNLKYRNYDQVRFDNQKLTYYMNDAGFLVARYGQDYNYS